MSSTPDRSCDVVIDKSFAKDNRIIQEKVSKVIDELLNSADPYLLIHGEPDLSGSGIEILDKKCKELSLYFEKLRVLNKYQFIPVVSNQEVSKLSIKRKILLKFTDNSKEDEVFNRDLHEIPEKLKEEIEQCQEVLKSLLNTDFPMETKKLKGYLELLHECNLLKIHSDPVCLFIQEEESKTLFENIIRLVYHSQA
jgi:mRNA-degrading endonuclease YafQ of YafQ-DinJ toxin-antitoxin module